MGICEVSLHLSFWDKMKHRLKVHMLMHATFLLIFYQMFRLLYGNWKLIYISSCLTVGFCAVELWMFAFSKFSTINRWQTMVPIFIASQMLLLYLEDLNFMITNSFHEYAEIPIVPRVPLSNDDLFI